MLKIKAKLFKTEATRGARNIKQKNIESTNWSFILKLGLDSKSLNPNEILPGVGSKTSSSGSMMDVIGGSLTSPARFPDQKFSGSDEASSLQSSSWSWMASLKSISRLKKTWSLLYVSTWICIWIYLIT
jgi:hypothetical protein